MQNKHFYSSRVYDFEVKEESLAPNIVYPQPILSPPEVRVYIHENTEDCPLSLGSSHIISPIYFPDPYEGWSTHSQHSSEIDYSSVSRDPSPFDYLAGLCYYLPEVIKDLVHQ